MLVVPDFKRNFKINYVSRELGQFSEAQPGPVQKVL